MQQLNGPVEEDENKVFEVSNITIPYQTAMSVLLLSYSYYFIFKFLYLYFTRKCKQSAMSTITEVKMDKRKRKCCKP